MKGTTLRALTPIALFGLFAASSVGCATTPSDCTPQSLEQKLQALISGKGELDADTLLSNVIGLERAKYYLRVRPLLRDAVGKLKDSINLALTRWLAKESSHTRGGSYSRLFDVLDIAMQDGWVKVDESLLELLLKAVGDENHEVHYRAAMATAACYAESGIGPKDFLECVRRANFNHETSGIQVLIALIRVCERNMPIDGAVAKSVIDQLFASEPHDHSFEKQIVQDTVNIYCWRMWGIDRELAIDQKSFHESKVIWNRNRKYVFFDKEAMIRKTERGVVVIPSFMIDEDARKRLTPIDPATGKVLP